MNRFEIMPCIDQSDVVESEEDGLVLPLISESCVLLFPITKEIADTVNYIKGVGDVDCEADLDKIEVYRTMVETWKSSGQFLSGILMDVHYDDEDEENMFSVSLILSNIADGYVEALTKVNFLHALIVGVLEDIDVMVGQELLSRLIPPDHLQHLAEPLEDADSEEFFSEEASENVNKYPYDHNIYQIAKKIMDGKIK
jgi:hypothetical protein